MLHGPAAPLKEDHAADWKARLGIKLFWLYALIYSGFVAVAVFGTAAMKRPVLAGVNLAVVYGMGLIVLAIVLGLIYNRVCSKKEDELRKAHEEEA